MSSKWIDILTDILAEITSALEFTESGGTLISDGTEQTVTMVDSPVRLIVPVTFLLSAVNNAAGDTIIVRLYYRIKSGGEYIAESALTISGAQSPALKTFGLLPNLYGFKVTVERTAGESRAYDWELVLTQ